jgi:Domain of unknown function (DUF4279)
MIDVELCQPIKQAGVTLIVWGADLEPEEISRVFGIQPTSSNRKGDQRGQNGRVSPNGRWLHAFSDRAASNINDQIRDAFAELPSDARTWTDLSTRFEIEIICYLFPSAVAEQFTLPPVTSALLAARYATVRFIHFGSNAEVENGQP